MESALRTLGGVPWVMAAVNFGLFANGFDSSLGQSVACLLNSGVLACLLLGQRPSTSFWRPFTPALTIFMVALAWVGAIAAIRALSMLGPDALPVAPDLFIPKFLATVSGLWALIIGILLGRTTGLPEVPGRWLLALICLHTAFGLSLFTFPDNLWSNWHPVWENRFAGLIGNANVTAAVCAVGCIIAWGQGLRYWMQRNDLSADVSISGALIYTAAFALNSVGLALSASRFVAMITLVMLAILAWPRKGESRVRAGIAIGCLVVLALLAAQSSLTDVLIVRWSNLQTESVSRWQMWEYFASMTGPALWIGYGSGAFSTVNTYFMQPDSWPYSLWQVNSPHDIFIQLLLVGGVPYLATMALGAAMIARDIFWRRARLLGNREHCTLVLATLAIMMFGVIDIALDVPVTTNMALLLAGICWQRIGAPPVVAASPSPMPIRPIRLEPSSSHR